MVTEMEYNGTLLQGKLITMTCDVFSVLLNPNNIYSIYSPILCVLVSR